MFVFRNGRTDCLPCRLGTYFPTGTASAVRSVQSRVLASPVRHALTPAGHCCVRPTAYFPTIPGACLYSATAVLCTISRCGRPSVTAVPVGHTSTPAHAVTLTASACVHSIYYDVNVAMPTGVYADSSTAEGRCADVSVATPTCTRWPAVQGRCGDVSVATPTYCAG